jgi:hypothetical protein
VSIPAPVRRNGRQPHLLELGKAAKREMAVAHQRARIRPAGAVELRQRRGDVVFDFVLFSILGLVLALLGIGLWTVAHWIW